MNSHRVGWKIATVLVAAYLLGVESISLAVQIPSEVKQAVTFIYIEKSDQTAANGTGFFVGIPYAADKNKIFIYLVTAKHVLQDESTGKLLSKVLLRLNTPTGTSKMLPLPLTTAGPRQNVFMHKDATVDLAVIPLAPDQNEFQYKVIGEELLTSRKDILDLKIREGTDVFFVGLFAPYLGNQRNYPIVRFGNVALITEERIPWVGNVLTDLFLMEFSSFGGNSGSPVFFYFNPDLEPGRLMLSRSPMLKFAGVVSGKFNDPELLRFAQQVENDKSRTAPAKPPSIPYTLINLGISGVTPAEKLQEILYGDDLKAQRALVQN